MTFARKIFIAVFLSTLVIGSILIWGAHRYAESRAEADFISRYTVFAKILANTLTGLDLNTESLMMNAAQVIAEKDKTTGLLSTEELRTLQRKLGITHLFIVDKTGRFLRSTNDDPAEIPNLFSFSPIYRKLLTGELAVEATPVIKPNPEPKPFKFLSIPNHDRSRIIEVGVRVDFIASTLAQAIRSDKNVISMSLFAPDGTPFGTFSQNNVIFQSQRAVLPRSFQTPVDSPDAIKFYSKVASSHTNCGECNLSGTSINGEYYYVLESTVSKAELNAIEAKANYVFLLAGIANAMVAWILALLLSKKLVKNIETAVQRVRQMKEQGTFEGRIGLHSDDEVAFLTREFDRLLDSLEKSQTKLVEAEKLESKVELARIVAHNIRSPILAIEMMIPGLLTVPVRMTSVLKNAVREIKELSEKLKNQSDLINDQQSEMDSDLVYLPIFLGELVKQKELEFSLLKTSLSLSILESGHNLFVRVSSIELKSVLSNLINNACEAYNGRHGEVEVILIARTNICCITISDNGVGIPREHIEKLGAKQFSSKGTATRGLGLLHAFNCISRWNGSISIDSKLHVGTKVHLQLPAYQDIEPSLRSLVAVRSSGADANQI